MHMTIRLYNTLTRKTDEFKTIEDGKVRLYTCGPTVYNYAHIGNLRTYLFEDILRRTLVHVGGFDVNHVMNVTDVGHLTDDADSGQDKMELSASREGRSVWEIADYYWQAFRNDIARLNILEPTTWCKATDEIDTQIAQIELIEKKGYTYKVEGEGIYFDTSKLEDYGKLAPKNIEGLQAGARVEMVEGKRNATDFALWKFSPADQKRLMEWESPWGTGFPGWHIECSAMAVKHLGDRLDIHCGGVDHINVHHTNEIAQAEVAIGHEWCYWWMHGEFLTIGEKMSKSSGNFLTLQSLIDDGYDPLAYRYFLLGAHYRQQLAFSFEQLDAAASALKNLRRAVIELKKDCDGCPGDPIKKHIASFNEAVSDDLNMPRALAAMWAVVKENSPAGNRLATLVEMDNILGLGIADMEDEQLDVDTGRIESLINERLEARSAKDWSRADAIRDELDAMGIEIMDSPEGTTWRSK